MKEIQTANSMFSAGHSCSQSVLAAFAERYNIPLEMALKLSCSFSGGIGGQGLTCGAVSGALMVLGLHSGRGTDPEDTTTKEQLDQLVVEFLSRFKDRHQTIVCNELTGIDRTNVEAFAQAKETGVYENLCPGLVEDAVTIVNELIARSTDESTNR